MSEYSSEQRVIFDLAAKNEELRADIARLRALVEDALRGLHNDFEPDNQSALYNRIKAALEPKPFA